MIVDCHTHIFSPEIIAGREAHLQQEEWFAHLYGATNAPMASARELVSEMDRCGIDKAVVCGFAWNSFDLYVETNSYIADAVSRFPKRLVGFANVPPLHPRAASELERCLALGLSGIGELKGQGQGFDLDDVEGLRPLTDIAMANNLPVLVHLSEPVGRFYPGKGGSSPRRGFNFAAANPGLKLIFAHWGGGLPFYELMPDVKEALASVWYDCSASPFLYQPEIYRIATDVVGPEKILFGSDFPLIPPDRYMRELESSGLTNQDRAAILGGNASKLLSLEES
ncbi:MAG: amidohydrolase family protein [Thermoleophilia bacterium]|nr:amidohydrolase family protein [Thermoleophilia bacterium]